MNMVRRFYKHPDGNETLLIKGLELDGVGDFVYYADYTLFLPPRHGKHFKISPQRNTNGCGPHSALMVLYYHGIDISVEVFEDVADIHTLIVGVTPAEMKLGLKNLGVPVYHYTGTTDGYSRRDSLRDKVSEKSTTDNYYKGGVHRLPS